MNRKHKIDFREHYLNSQKQTKGLKSAANFTLSNKEIMHITEETHIL